ncbi:MAG: hypothetical protein M3A24_05755 [Candidatus Rhabdochlamydia oedothoracis]|nr:hypothetical protein [Candidatus Rhabdochlamydia oedothoracis]
MDIPLCFAVGGDAYYYLDLMRKMALQIAARSPDFVVVGGYILKCIRKKTFQTLNSLNFSH